MKKKLLKEKIKHNIDFVNVCVKDFIIDKLWIYFIELSIIIIIALLFNRIIESVYVITSYLLVGMCFEKQFRFNVIAFALTTLISFNFFLISYVLNIKYCFVSLEIITYLICMLSYSMQELYDLSKDIEKLQRHATKTVMKISNEEIYLMTEKQLQRYCKFCGLNKIDSLIVYFVVIERLKDKELYNAFIYNKKNKDIKKIPNK